MCTPISTTFVVLSIKRKTLSPVLNLSSSVSGTTKTPVKVPSASVRRVSPNFFKFLYTSVEVASVTPLTAEIVHKFLTPLALSTAPVSWSDRAKPFLIFAI